MAEFDCTIPENKPYCKLLGIVRYPTMLLFNNGISYAYEGKRSLDDFAEFLNGGWTDESVMQGDIPDMHIDSVVFGEGTDVVTKQTALAFHVIVILCVIALVATSLFIRNQRTQRHKSS